MSEELIVRHCSPTLAGMKTGSMFTCSFASKAELTEYVRGLNKRLVPKGLRAIPLRASEGRALVYLYRPAQLRRDFSGKPVQDILERHGYACNHTERCVMRLIDRLRSEPEFPHEIGLFLGYPAEDVQGFIENQAADSKCVGCWKVYGDEQAAKKLFAKYKKCTDVYCAQWKNEKSIEKLAVAG